MTATLTIRDETSTGHATREFTLDFLTERITVRELIRSRVYQEVQDFNAKRPEVFRGLVQPTEAEIVMNGFKLKKRATIDWRPQFELAVEAFERSRILILVDDRQVDSLEDEIVISPSSRVSFVKLVPLVGG